MDFPVADFPVIIFTFPGTNFNVLFFNIDYNVINDNKRIDNYGGSKENKIKLILEIIKKIKDKVKNNFLLYLNININILNLI